MDKQHQEYMRKMLDTMERLTNAISDGFSVLKQRLTPSQPHRPQPNPNPPQHTYPCHPHNFHQTELPNMYAE